MTNSKYWTVLIVDDEESIRASLNDFLSMEGYRVTLAASQNEAIERLLSTEFDVLLVDKNLPDGTGMNVIEKCRTLQHRTEIIVMTGYANLESAIAAVNLHVFRYVEKPFRLGEMADHIEAAIQYRNQRPWG